ncbi:hypothetical protein GWK47_002627 [Chionoecetes opilio]|uniref:Secreted protein n=1 Tax=Chionoecetes opilio TaxID=41210 RepID=A0A8J5CCV0_CHIOP|nr:hypothetical protein GWK47_002627 [Chionoecetes opilio]
MRLLLAPSWTTGLVLCLQAVKKCCLFPHFLDQAHPSIMVAGGSGITSAGETFLSNSLARAALLVLRRTHHRWQVPMAKAPGDEPRDITHFELSVLSNKDHLAK